MKAKTKWSRGLGMILGCVMMLVLFPMTALAEGEEGVAINETNFPDIFFRSFVESYDKDENGVLSPDEISEVTKIDCRFIGIKKLDGIEYFTALETLDCFSTLLTSLDVSKNTALKELSCGSNQLTNLDVRQNTALEKLDCSSNQLTGLDVNTGLKELICNSNQLTGLDVRQNTALEKLDCNNNQLTGLDVNTGLKELSCANNQLTGLDVRQNTALVNLECSNNQLTSLNVSKNTALVVLRCSGNQLTNLDVRQNRALNALGCSDNQLTSLDVSQNTALEYLACTGNQLTDLDVSKRTALVHLECADNRLTSLDVSKNTALWYLNCANNQLTSLDVRQNTGLEFLECSGNRLTSLDVSKHTGLHYLFCSDNRREIEVKNDRLFDLSTLTGFDMSKVSDWVGGSVNGNLLCFDNVPGTVTYSYDSGNSYWGKLSFQLCAKLHTCVYDQQIVKNEALKTPADCTHDAVYYKSCSCGEISKAETDIFTAANTALGHNFNQEIVKNEALKTPADCTHDAVYYKSCSCGEISKAETDIFTAANTALGHDWTTDWGQDADKHWHECKRCHEKKDEAAHSLKTTIIPATLTKAGKSETSCTICEKVTDTKTIAAIKTVKLLTTTFVYDGKTKTPKLTVKDSAGKTIPATYYAVKKSKGCKEVGKYTYKITFKGNYKGTKTLTFTINPKGTTLVSAKAESKGFTVKWKKQATQTTGYEIRFATNQKMDKAKTVKITKNGETSKKITKLAAKKKYYVQIRTYKKVGSKTYYSDWSKTKTVTTKK